LTEIDGKLNRTLAAIAMRRFDHILLGINDEGCIIGVPDTFGNMNRGIARKLGFGIFRLCAPGRADAPLDGRPGYRLKKIEEN